jgi:hypothetical protein
MEPAHARNCVDADALLGISTLNRKVCGRAVKLLLAIAESPACYRLLSVTNNSQKYPTAAQSTPQYSPSLPSIILI